MMFFIDIGVVLVFFFFMQENRISTNFMKITPLWTPETVGSVLHSLWSMSFSTDNHFLNFRDPLQPLHQKGEKGVALEGEK